MRALRSLLPVVCLLLLFLALPAAADDEKSELWVYRKGEHTTEIDVASMPDAIRKALHAQLTATGWSRVEAVSAKEGPAKGEETTKKDDADKPAVSGATKKDLEEIVKRGGTLPGGFVPHGMGPGGPRGPGGMGPGGELGGAQGEALMQALAKATGKLLLRYLDVKDDPVKGPVYEDVLRNLAKALIDGGGGQAGIQQMGMRLMGRFMGGMQDPDKAPVYREIMGIFSEVMGAAMRGAMGGGMPPGMPRPPKTPPAPTAGPFKDAPRDIGGAVIVYRMQATGPGEFEILPGIGAVPPGSAAAQAGFQPGDRIEQVDGKAVDAAGLKHAHRVFSEGGKLTLRLRRKDGSVEELELDISLEEAPADDR